ALKCLGGTLQARLWAKDHEERIKAREAGHDVDQFLTMNNQVNFVNGFFSATLLTHGEQLRGLRQRAATATTQSLVMRSKSGTIRQIESVHQLAKLRAYSAIDFDRGR